MTNAEWRYYIATVWYWNEESGWGREIYRNRSTSPDGFRAWIRTERADDIVAIGPVSLSRVQDRIEHHRLVTSWR